MQPVQVEIENQYRQIRQAMAGQLRSLAELARELGVASAAKSFANYVRDLEQGGFKVMVMGDFSSGKTTLLNAILGQQFLATKLTPATAIITVIRYGPQPQIVVTFQDDRQPEIYAEADFSTYNDKYQLRGEQEMTSELEERFAAVKEAILEAPLDFLKHGIQIVDSPGLNESKLATRITNQYVPYADAVLFIFRATNLITLEEKKYVTEMLLPLGPEKIFYLINMWDLIDEMAADPETTRRELWQRAQNELRPLLPVADSGQVLFPERVFPLSARNAVKAQAVVPPDQDLLTNSGLPAMLSALEAFLLQDRNRLVIEKIYVQSKKMVHEDMAAAMENLVAAAGVPMEELTARYQAVIGLKTSLEQISNAVSSDIDHTAELARRRAFEKILAFAGHLEKVVLPAAARQVEPVQVGFFDLITQERRLKLQRRMEDAFTGELKKRLDEAVVTFCRGELSQEFTTLFTALHDKLHSRAAKYDEVLAKIDNTLTGRAAGRPSAEARWLIAGAAQALPDPNKILGQMDLGLSQLVEETIVQIVTTLVQMMLAYLLVGGLFSFFTGIIITVIAAIIKAIVGMKSNIQELIRDRMAADLAKNLQGKITVVVQEQEKQIKADIAGLFTGMRDGIRESMRQDAINLEVYLRQIMSRKDEAAAEEGDVRNRVTGIMDKARQLIAGLEAQTLKARHNARQA